MKGFSKINLLLSSLLMSTAVSAEGFYLGGAIGNAKLSASNDVIENFFNINKHQEFETDSVLSKGLYGGYDFNRWFSIESSVFYMKDELEYNNEVTGVYFSLTPKFTIPIHELFSIYAKVGLAYMTLEYDIKYNDNTRDDISDSQGNTSFILGMGANANITEYLTLTIGYDWIQSIGSYAFADNVTIEQVTLGLAYKF